MTLYDYSPLLWMILALLLRRSAERFPPACWLPCLAGWLSALLGCSLFHQEILALTGLTAGLLLGRIRLVPRRTEPVPGDLAVVIVPFTRTDGGQIRCRGRIFPALCHPDETARTVGEIVEITGADGVFYRCR